MEKKQRLIWFVKRCLLALTVAALCYLMFGVIGGWCLFRRITGLPCLTCGMGARLAVRPAAGLCQSLFLASAVLDRSARGSLSHFFGARRWILRGLTACLLLFVMVYALRMLLLFPHTPPMTFDPDGILPRLFGWRF